MGKNNVVDNKKVEDFLNKEEYDYTKKSQVRGFTVGQNRSTPGFRVRNISSNGDITIILYDTKEGLKRTEIDHSKNGHVTISNAR